MQDHARPTFAQFAFASGNRCTGRQVRKGTGFVPISDLPSEDEEQDEEEAGVLSTHLLQFKLQNFSARVTHILSAEIFPLFFQRGLPCRSCLG